MSHAPWIIAGAVAVAAGAAGFAWWYYARAPAPAAAARPVNLAASVDANGAAGNAPTLANVAASGATRIHAPTVDATDPKAVAPAAPASSPTAITSANALIGAAGGFGNVGVMGGIHAATLAGSSFNPN